MFQKFGDLLSKVILLVFLSIVCTTIHYQSNETIPVLWGSQKEVTDETKMILGKKEFYLWGLYPKNQSVFLDDEFRKFGFKKINKFVIEEFQTTLDKIKEYATFGMYIPKRYKLIGHGKKVN